MWFISNWNLVNRWNSRASTMVDVAVDQCNRFEITNTAATNKFYSISLNGSVCGAIKCFVVEFIWLNTGSKSSGSGMSSNCFCFVSVPPRRKQMAQRKSFRNEKRTIEWKRIQIFLKSKKKKIRNKNEAKSTKILCVLKTIYWTQVEGKLLKLFNTFS